MLSERNARKNSTFRNDKFVTNFDQIETMGSGEGILFHIEWPKEKLGNEQSALKLIPSTRLPVPVIFHDRRCYQLWLIVH